MKVKIKHIVDMDWIKLLKILANRFNTHLLNIFVFNNQIFNAI